MKIMKEYPLEHIIVYIECVPANFLSIKIWNMGIEVTREN